MSNKNKHKNYEILNLLGLKTKSDFYNAMVDYGIKGWWQKGDACIHRKHFIDSLFGSLNVVSYNSENVFARTISI